MTNEQPDLTPLLQQIIDKLNRVEANVANLKSAPDELKDAIDRAVEKLTLCVMRHGR